MLILAAYLGVTGSNMSEQRPLVHLFIGSPNYAEVIAQASSEARRTGWDTIDFSNPGIARRWLEASPPDAFVSYLSLQARGQPNHPLRQQPVLDLVERAQELEIPVALLTPRRPNAVGVHLQPSRDVMIGAGLTWTRPEVFTNSLVEWLGEIAGQSARPQA
jgi:hypothetical protein